MNIFLFAPPEVILGRKQEMDEESIVLLTNKYKQLFDQFETTERGKYISIENINKDATISIIENLYLKVSS